MMLPSEESEDILFAKLDVIKDLRSKTMHLEKVKARILQEMQLIKKEDQHLTDYRTEIGNLKRERLMHIESLQLIERDIAVIESTVAEAKHERDKIQERASLLYQEFNPLKREIDLQRTQIGLDRLTEIPNEDFSFCRESSSSQPTNLRNSVAANGSRACFPTNDFSRYSPEPSQSSASTNQHLKCQGGRPRRQQQPPMKTCSTCQELIHRNAPVCPLCKAKSTSRNSKKTKTRHDSPT